MAYSVKNWKEFQHYKDRSPTWIKLHKYLLDDYEFHSLPVASRALAPMLWLLASEYEDASSGVIEGTDQKICFRLRMSVEEFVKAIKPLIEKGFIISDSTVLAEPERDASPEKEESKRHIEKKEEVETERDSQPKNFELFWKAFPNKRKGNREKGLGAYRQAMKRATEEEIYAGLENYTRSDEVARGFAKGAAAWLNDDRWSFDYSAPRATANGKSAYGDSLQAAAEAARRVLDEKEGLRAQGSG